MYNTNQFIPYYGRPPYYVGYQQPVAQQPMQQQNEMPFNEVKYLNAKQIDGYIPPIGGRVMLIDKENGLAYIESADVYGNTYKDVYSFTNINKQEENKASLDFENLATKDDVNKILAEFKAIHGQNATVTNNLPAKIQKPATDGLKQA